MSRLCLPQHFQSRFLAYVCFGNGGSNTCILRDFFYSRWHSTRQHFCAWVAKVPRLAARTNANEEDHRWNRWRRRTDTFLKLQAVLDQPWFGVGIYIPILDDQAHGPENLFSVRLLTPIIQFVQGLSLTGVIHCMPNPTVWLQAERLSWGERAFGLRCLSHDIFPCNHLMPFDDRQPGANLVHAPAKRGNTMRFM